MTRFVIPSAARDLLLLFALLAAPLSAQTVQAEARVEATGPEPYVLQPGVAFGVPAGRYVRVSGGSTIGERQRVDLLARFTFDPYRERRFALSLGGGVSVHKTRTYLAVVADVEGPTFGRLVPMIQAGLGGGARFAAGVRQSIRGRR